MSNNYAAVQEIVDKVMNRGAGIACSAACQGAPAVALDGIYDTPDSAVKAAVEGFKAIAKIPLEQRGEFIDAIRKAIAKHAQELARIEVEETTMGRYENKVTKILLTAEKTPGIDSIKPQAYVGDYGLTVEEHLPYGIALCILPSTAPCATPIGNAICMIAAGNSVIFSPHPNATKSTVRTVAIINEAIAGVGGPSSLVSCLSKSTFAYTNELIVHPDVNLLVATGGPSIVKKLLSSGKKAIGAGEGNPPAVVDEGADLVNAARCILAGNYFEFGIQCICEKGIIVLESVADAFVEEIANQGAYLIKDQGTIDKLTNLVATAEGTPNKDYLGKDPVFILQALGIQAPAGTKSIVYEVSPSHCTFAKEYLMPLLPLVRAKDFDEAVAIAVEMESGHHHTAMVHSQNVSNLSKFVRALGCTIMVKNGPSYAGLGLGGEGFATATVASPTGEGITTPRSFTRMTRCSMIGEFNLRSALL